MSRKKATVETTATEEEILQAAETEAEAVEAEAPEAGDSTPENDGEETMDQIIYLGPTKKGIVSGTVFIGGYTDVATSLIKAVPAARLLFVSISEAAAAMAEIQEKGTARQIAFDQAWKAEL